MPILSSFICARIQQKDKYWLRICARNIEIRYAPYYMVRAEVGFYGKKTESKLVM